MSPSNLTQGDLLVLGQASARRSSGEDGFGSVVGSRGRPRSQSPLSPAASGQAAPSTGPSQAQGPHEGSRHGRSEGPQSPTLQPAATPIMAQTPTLGTGDQS